MTEFMVYRSSELSHCGENWGTFFCDIDMNIWHNSSFKWSEKQDN